MFRPLCHVSLAALLPLALGACAPSLPRMASSFALDGEPAASVRGAAPLDEDAPSVASAEVPAHQPLPLDRGRRCGATPGEQARAQCLRGSATADAARP